MNRRVIWASRAQTDYLTILDHIRADNPAAAKRVAHRIISTVAGLADFATGRAGGVLGTYEKVVAGLPYIVIYELSRADSGGERVEILHIIHGARKWPPGTETDDRSI